MADSHSLINLGELSKPVTVLIQKISDALGGYFKPWQIRRIAQAEAEADKIAALAEIEIRKIGDTILFISSPPAGARCARPPTPSWLDGK